MGKKYYWLQLKEDFFRQKEIKLLRKIAGGDTYTIIYLKMMLMSLKDEGKILFEGIGNSFAEEVALEIDEDIENVQVTFQYLLSKDLLQVSEYEGFMSDVPSLIGSETDSARRVRKHRKLKEKHQKKLQSNDKTLQSDDTVTSCNTEIDIELELDKEIDIEQEPDTKQEYLENYEERNTKSSNTNKKALSSDLDRIPYKDIIDHLNNKANRSYRHTTNKNQSLIKARWSEGFSMDDFKTVIDNKVNEWEETDMSKYLRPETLFGAKFEGYLNQNPVDEPTRTDERYNDLPI